MGNMEVPNVKRKDFQLIGMDDDFLSLMDDNGDTRDDLKCPEDAVGEEIRNAIDKETDILVTCLSACGEECVIATKVNTAVDNKKSWSLSHAHGIKISKILQSADPLNFNNCRRFQTKYEIKCSASHSYKSCALCGLLSCDFNLKIIFVFI